MHGWPVGPTATATTTTLHRSTAAPHLGVHRRFGLQVAAQCGAARPGALATMDESEFATNLCELLDELGDEATPSGGAAAPDAAPEAPQVPRLSAAPAAEAEEPDASEGEGDDDERNEFDAGGDDCGDLDDTDGRMMRELFHPPDPPACTPTKKKAAGTTAAASATASGSPAATAMSDTGASEETLCLGLWATGIALVLIWFCFGVVLVLHWHCTGSALALYWHLCVSLCRSGRSCCLLRRSRRPMTLGERHYPDSVSSQTIDDLAFDLKRSPGRHGVSTCCSAV